VGRQSYASTNLTTEESVPKITLKWMPKQKRARGRPTKNWMEGIKKAMNERNLNEGQWEDRKQWSLGVRQRRKKFSNFIYICIYDRLCGLVVRVSGYRYRGPGFDSRFSERD
jgi:hypothetical protein